MRTHSAALLLAGVLSSAGCPTPCAGAEAPPNPRQRLLRLILEEQITIEVLLHRLQSWQFDGKDMPVATWEEARKALTSDDAGLRRMAVLVLARMPLTPERRDLFTTLLRDRDAHVAFNAARALALHGDKAGVQLLREVAWGRGVRTSSGFELDAAAWALLALDEEPPPSDRRHSWGAGGAYKLDPQLREAIRALGGPGKKE